MQDLKSQPGQIVVLLVDDQAFVGAAVGRLLAAEHDIALHCCRNALDAVAMANQLNPAIIFQDLIMPDLDGLTLVGLFRTNPPTAKTPVIVLSGNDDPEARTRALAQGANDYLIKLPPKDDLIACIRRYGVAGTAAPAESGSSGRDRVAATRESDKGETLDRSILAAFRQADGPGASNFTGNLIDLFLREAASQIELLKNAARCSDTRGLEATAHSLKGSSMTIGANKLAALCARVEGDAAGNRGGVAAEVVLAEFDREFVRVRDALAEERHSQDQL